MLNSPRWLKSELGLPMPDSPHAVSACLPLWEHNIGYEEGDAAVIDRLQAAYPRFCLHPEVRRLFATIFKTPGRLGYLFPSQRSARRAMDYFVWRGGSSARQVDVDGQPVTGVEVDVDELSLLREYWQHSGEVISSRSAEEILLGKRVEFSDQQLRQKLRQRVAGNQQGLEENVFLYPSGMAAVAAAWRAFRAIDPASASAQFGFPYVDTLKIQQRFQPADCRFFPVGSADDLQALQEALKDHQIGAVFCETPANPLLTCPDLKRLRELADQYGFLLIVDDTLAACINLRVLEYADMVVTSLTKYFSGYGDVLAGSLTLNAEGSRYQQLRSFLNDDFEELLSDTDAAVLERNSRDLRQRVEIINSNAAEVAKRLVEHSAVDRVWHPSVGDQPNYERLRREGGGYGGLLSVLLKDPAATTPAVFDALQVCKGPNLGTYFTLCCPYTILAHYLELDFVESCGVSRWLLRISVGTEPIEELWERFERALNVALPAVSP